MRSMMTNLTFDAFSDRNGARLAASFPITLSRAGEAIGYAIIRNVSTYGFMADGKPPVDIGEIVTAHLFGGEPVEVRIAWALCGRLGAEFMPPIEDDLVRRIAAAAADDR